MTSNITHLKRLQKDFQALQNHPIIGCSASPLPKDLTLWHCNIEVPLTINKQKKVAPIHLLIEISSDYPSNPPNVGFCTEFPYSMGATLYARDGRIKGLFEICLNILGNLSKVHTEWKEAVGEGWSVGMSISTLLVNLQSIMLDLDKELHTKEKEKLYQDLVSFKLKIQEGDWHVEHSAEHPWPELAKQQPSISEKKGWKNYQEMFQDQEGTIETFIKKVKLNEEHKPDLYNLIGEIIEKQNQQPQNQQNEANKLKKIKEEIFCYISGVSFDEDILGYGIYKDRNLISTYAELLSYSQFKNGHRQSSNKSQFSHFLPAFICPEHANDKWKEVTKKCINEICILMGVHNNSFNDKVLVVLPKLLNSMIVEMKKNSKAQAIAFFQAMCSFWRTLRTFYSNDEELKDAAIKMLKDFIRSESKRHKDICPDIGVILAISTTLTDQIDCSSFIDSYLDENFIRCVMWWYEGSSSKSSNNVFLQTQVSRELLIFQLLLIKIIIGTSPKQTEQMLDESFGQMPKQLDTFQQELKKLHINSWQNFFESTGCSKTFTNKILDSTSNWINECIKRSNEKGRKYRKNY